MAGLEIGVFLCICDGGELLAGSRYVCDVIFRSSRALRDGIVRLIFLCNEMGDREICDVWSRDECSTRCFVSIVPSE